MKDQNLPIEAERVFKLLGAKDVEIDFLRERIANLEQELKAIKGKSSGPLTNKPTQEAEK